MKKFQYRKLVDPALRDELLIHVGKTLAVSNRRPASEITDALLSWERAQEHFSNLTSALGDVKGKKLLDVGSGFGLFLTTSLLAGANSTGLEPATNKAYSLTQKISRSILKNAGFSTTLVRDGLGEKMPFKDNSFDIVASFYTLEHVNNVRKVLRESVRVLKPGGYIFFEVPNYGSFWEGHYGILWIPFISKKLARLYVRLWGKDSNLIKELQFVNVYMLRHISKNLPITILDTGKSNFRKKVLLSKFTKVGTLGSAAKIIDFLRATKLLGLFVILACLLEAQTPIIFVAKKMLNKLSITLGIDANYFVKGGFWLGLSTGLSLVGGIFLSSFFARVWPADVYGQFSFLMSALGFVSVTALPGMGQALTQASAEGRDGSYKKATKFVAKWSLTGTLLLIIGSMYFYFRHNPNLALAVFVCAIAFPITSATGLCTSFLTGKKKFRSVGIFNIILQYTSILATVFALWKMPSIVWVALFSSWSTAITGVVLTLIAFKDINNKKLDTKLETLGKSLSMSQVFTIVADNFDKFLIPLMLGFTSNAVYAFAILIPMQIHTFLKIILSMLQPKFANFSVKNLQKDLPRRALQFELILALIVASYILISPFLFKYLYPSYSNSALQLSQLFSISLLYYPGNMFGLLIVKKRETVFIQKINIIYFAVNTISLLVLTPFFGLIGVVASKVLSKFIHGYSQYYFASRLKS